MPHACVSPCPAAPHRFQNGLGHLRRANASVAPGTSTHRAMEQLKARLDLSIAHAPYRVFGPATLDLVAVIARLGLRGAA